MYKSVSGGIICVPSRFTFGSLLEKQSAAPGPVFFSFPFSLQNLDGSAQSIRGENKVYGKGKGGERERP